ncbi:gamma-secretase-activating protein [Protopterus annectens]|uniref:gamma-secretase-activating protein n=1 Tax=Protopterus annectens TaxID=7888 RepID=UPI001CFBE02D|nr:gamma-secretase-activating protein [Protopterus annectens]
MIGLYWGTLIGSRPPENLYLIGSYTAFMVGCKYGLRASQKLQSRANAVLVNFGFNPYQSDVGASSTLNFSVLSSEIDCAVINAEPRRKTGSMFLCYSHLPPTDNEVSYTIAFVLQGVSKTFTVSVEETEILTEKVIFINLGYYIAVYLPGHFLHLINTRHPKLLCHHLLLSGADASMPSLNTNGYLQSLPYSSILDYSSGKMFEVCINQLYLVKFLQTSTLDCHWLAALHCALIYFKDQTETEAQVVSWICDNIGKCSRFDVIQEFIWASLYRRMCPESINLDKLLPYTSLMKWEGEVPGVTCVTEIAEQSVFRALHLKGFWAELHSNLQSFMYLDAEPCCRYYNNSKLLRKQWKQLIEEMKTEERTSSSLRTILQNAEKVLLTLDKWVSDQRIVPLFQEEKDYQQNILMGVMVENMKDHLMRHLQHMGKKKTEELVINYVAKLLELIRNIMETVWRKYNVKNWKFCFKERGSSSEYAVFHIMCHILQATSGMCVPLPPGFQTLHATLGVRCLPLHTLLCYIDHGILRLTETFIKKLLIDFNNSEKNGQLKLSIITRLPEAASQNICHLWDHPISSSLIARNYVEALLQKLGSKQMYPHNSPSYETDSSVFYSDFLPLNYLTKTLTDVKNLAMNPFEEKEYIDAKFVEEIALKQTSILLQLES